MENNFIFDMLIPLWPAVVLVAMLITLFAPDRWWRGDRLHEDLSEVSHDRRFLVMPILWGVAALWFVPAYMATPGAAGFSTDGFGAAVLRTLGHEARHLYGIFAVLSLFVALYVVAGVVWAILHFWLYARRLGHLYVMERDAWLQGEKVSGLDALSDAQRTRFDQVIQRVKRTMLYRGDFPLRPLQQKRFFVSNVVLWPLTVVAYILGDLVIDVARSVWFALRNWLHRKWVTGMKQYLDDEAVCLAYQADMKGNPMDERDIELDSGYSRA